MFKYVTLEEYIILLFSNKKNKTKGEEEKKIEKTKNIKKLLVIKIVGFSILLIILLIQIFRIVIFDFNSILMIRK